MFLWALAAVVYGLGQIFAGNIPHLSAIIVSGDLDVYLTQPRPVALNAACSRMAVAGWGDILYGIIVYAFTQPLKPGPMLLFLLLSILGTIAMAAARLIFHSLSFWLHNAEGLAFTLDEMLLSFTLYPPTLFPPPVRALFNLCRAVGPGGLDTGGTLPFFLRREDASAARGGCGAGSRGLWNFPAGTSPLFLGGTAWAREYKKRPRRSGGWTPENRMGVRITDRDDSAAGVSSWSPAIQKSRKDLVAALYGNYIPHMNFPMRLTAAVLLMSGLISEIAAADELWEQAMLRVSPENTLRAPTLIMTNQENNRDGEMIEETVIELSWNETEGTIRHHIGARRRKRRYREGTEKKQTPEQ